MIVSGHAKHFFQSNEPDRRRIDEANKAFGDDGRSETIPARYRNECGGIDLEQVQRDRHEARRQVVQAMIQSLGKMWRRR